MIASSGIQANDQLVIKASPLDSELEHRVNLLARYIRIGNSFTRTAATWAGFPLRRIPAQPDVIQELSDEEAIYFDLSAGDSVLFRAGWLVPTIDQRNQWRAAFVTAVINQRVLGLTLEQRSALTAGTVPLGYILQGAQRSTHYVKRAHSNPSDLDLIALTTQATLTLNGIPAALVRESVQWRLVHHREEPHMIAPLQRSYS